jgi:16S rRNA (cytidine1402-2'-O)-methyltransferase
MPGTLGTLFVVATPIGNLEDVTLRALRVLREVAVVAAEDTRRTSRLLQHYSISTPTISLHEHNEHSRTKALLDRLARGESVALVSDAGTPIVSDPGAQLVAAAHVSGIRVEPVPGPSAVLAAVSASGFGGEGFVFLGFPPARPQPRRLWLRLQKQLDDRVLVLYEAPHRIRDTLEDIRDILGDRVIAVGRELTKAHEELVVRPISRYLQQLQEPRGEYTVVISPATPAEEQAVELPKGELVAEFGQLTEQGALSRRAIVKQLAAKYRVSQREVYATIEHAKISGI